MNTNITIETLESIYLTQKEQLQKAVRSNASIGTTTLNNQTHTTNGTLKEVKATAITSEQIEAAIKSVFEGQQDLINLGIAASAISSVIGLAMYVSALAFVCLGITLAPEIFIPLVVVGALLFSCGGGSIAGLVAASYENQEEFETKKSQEFIDFVKESANSTKLVLEGGLDSVFETFQEKLRLDRMEENFPKIIEKQKEKYAEKIKKLEERCAEHLNNQKANVAEAEQQIAAEAKK